MALTKTDVINIAHLARIDIDEADIPEYVSNLSNILDMMEQLQIADTHEVEPMAHPLDAIQRLRPDVVTESNHRDEYQAIAPAVEDGLFLVPKVIE